MTTNRMGLTPEMGLKISNEQIDDETLTELIEFRRGSLDYHVKQGNKTQALMHGAVLSALRELLAYRAESKEPLAYTEKHEISNMHATGLYLRAWPADRDRNTVEGHTIALYAAPPIQTVTAPGGWIKCSERMPEDDTLCLAIDSDGVIWSAHYDDEEMRLDGLTAPIRPMITHWMLLPAAPLSHSATS